MESALDKLGRVGDTSTEVSAGYRAETKSIAHLVQPAMTPAIQCPGIDSLVPSAPSSNDPGFRSDNPADFRNAR